MAHTVNTPFMFVIKTEPLFFFSRHTSPPTPAYLLWTVGVKAFQNMTFNYQVNQEHCNFMIPVASKLKPWLLRFIEGNAHKCQRPKLNI